MNNRVLINFGIFICLLLPKFNIVNIKGFAQGIRYDDIFLLFCLIIIIINNKLALSIFPNKSLYFFFYIYLIFYGLISYYTTNSYAIILPLRWIEYSVFYMIIARLKMSLKEIRYMIIGYIIFNVIFVYLQYIHVLGGIYSHGYISDVSTRISGLTGGSWELPAVLAMLVSASITDDYYKKRRMILFLIIITSTIMAYLSGTRTGMIVYLLGIGFALIGKYKINIQVILALFVIGYIFINQDRMLVMTKDGQLPYSMEIRLFAWNEYFSKMDYGDYLFGKGLGYSGLHVDGMYSKVFIDMGILGIIIYLCFYIRLLYNYKVIGLIVMLYCITIDFFTASKLMFGMYLGLYYMQQQSKLTIRN